MGLRAIFHTGSSAAVMLGASIAGSIMRISEVLKRLEDDLFYAILDVTLDIEVDVEVGTERIYVPFCRRLIRFEVLCPAATPGMMDR